jgi:hypothetical protein
MSRFALPAAALLLAAMAVPASGQSRPNLSGNWVLKTDTPPPADSATAGADSAQIGGDTLAFGGPASDLRPVLRRRGRPEDDQQLRRLIGMAQPVAAFRITQADTAVTFVNEDGLTYVVRPGRDRDSIVVGDEVVRVRARWRGPALEVEFHPPGGGRIVETYLLADSRTFLRVEVVVEHDILAQRLWRPRMYRLAGPG